MLLSSTWRPRVPLLGTDAAAEVMLGGNHCLPLLVLGVLLPRGITVASTGLGFNSPSLPLTRAQLLARLALWGVLFSIAALLAGAETAITTLWPWKVKQMAAEEGEGSPFATLQSDITKVLGTVLIGVTFCTIFGTALLTDVAVGLFGKAGVGYATAAITFVTLFFGEIFPKSLAVAKPERLARFSLPMINAFTYLLTPFSWLTSFATSRLLATLGSSADESAEAVTKPELRMVLSSASESGAVELYEQDMIEGVLDLQRTQVQQIMTPRVEIEAIESSAFLHELLEVAQRTKYSRVPVYNETVDEIVGIVLTRELLNYPSEPRQSQLGDEERVSDEAAVASLVSSSLRQLEQVTVESVMEGVDGASLFAPESMSVMNALKQSRRLLSHPAATRSLLLHTVAPLDTVPASLDCAPQVRRQRLHMMVVVDEFGGTSGIVTLEDVREEGPASCHLNLIVSPLMRCAPRSSRPSSARFTMKMMRRTWRRIRHQSSRRWMALLRLMGWCAATASLSSLRTALATSGHAGSASRRLTSQSSASGSNLRSMLTRKPVPNTQPCLASYAIKQERYPVFATSYLLHTSGSTSSKRMSAACSPSRPRISPTRERTIHPFCIQDACNTRW